VRICKRLSKLPSEIALGAKRNEWLGVGGSPLHLRVPGKFALGLGTAFSPAGDEEVVECSSTHTERE
jgi:hypothetical protein